MSKIIKGIPIPKELLDGTGKPARGGWKPIYPFRQMEVGDYWEERLLDSKQKAKVLVALRNLRKSKPELNFVWQTGLSVDPEKARTNLPYLKVWRTENSKVRK